MKRFFFLTVAATALFAACNKTEIVPTGPPTLYTLVFLPRFYLIL